MTEAQLQDLLRRGEELNKVASEIELENEVKRKEYSYGTQVRND